jgi:excisionase family DNA binding protein
VGTPPGPSIGDTRSDHRDDDLLTVAEAARIAHRSVRTVRRAYLAGRMVAHRDGNGRGVTIRHADLLAWLTAEVIRPRSVAVTANSVVRVGVRAKGPPLDTGNLELLSAARSKRTAHARVSAAPRASAAPRGRHAGD